MKVPTWGWPWHGPVDEYGNVTLPNGQIKQIANAGFGSYNFIYRVKVPGVAPIERSVEELEQDALAGREWRNEALMTGFTLYAQGLPGWIYSSPDGSKWTIDIKPETIRETSNAVQAKRFGVLGGKPVTQDLTINWPIDDGLYYGAVVNVTDVPSQPPSTKVYRELYPIDISPDGSRAIYMLYAERDMPSGLVIHPRMYYIPLGFQLVTVSGGMDGIQIQTSTLRTLQQTLGVATITDNVITELWTNRRRFGHVGDNGLDSNRKRPDPPGTNYYPAESGEDRYGADYGITNGTSERRIEGRILALWFDVNDQIVECTLDWSDEDFYKSDQPVPVPKGGGSYTWGRISEGRRTTTTRLKVDGHLVCEFVDVIDSSTDSIQDPVYTLIVDSRDDGWQRVTEYFFGNWYGTAPLPIWSMGRFLAGRDYWRLVTAKLACFVRWNDPLSTGPDAEVMQYHGFGTPHGPLIRSGITTRQVGTLIGELNIRYNPYSGELSDPDVPIRTFI